MRRAAVDGLGAGRGSAGVGPTQLGTGRSEQLINFLGLEAHQLGYFALRILSVDFDKTGDEEVFFLGGTSLPIVWFANGDDEAGVASPISALLLFRSSGWGEKEGLDDGDVLHVPSFADGEGTGAVLASLVDTYAAGIPYCDDYDARFLILVRRVRGRGALWVCGVLCNANVGNVGLLH